MGGSSFGAVIPVTGLNVGFPGQPSRTGDLVIASRQANSSNAHAISFGAAVVLIGDSAGGTWRSAADFIAQGGTFTAASFAGVAIREVKTNLAYISLEQNGSNAPIVGSYVAGEMAEALERGSITVVINVGTPQAGGIVYVRKTANGAIPAGIVGGFEAAADGSNTVALNNVVFRTGVLDANNVAEITLLTRQSA